MLRNLLFWVLAIIITLASAVYQRKTGPTWPASGSALLDSSRIDYVFTRSHSTSAGQPVTVAAPDTAMFGDLVYRRYKTNDNWTYIPLARQGDSLKAILPAQPPAGKLEYYIVIHKANSVISLPQNETIVTRFKGDVPAWALVPHILCMFFGMLFSTRTGLEALKPKGNLQTYTIITLVLLALGGMVMGPIVQKYAFGAYWTGFPLGYDLTDNKTLIAVLAWLLALVAVLKKSRIRGWIFAASFITLVIFMIPHSMRGSELDYAALDAEKAGAVSNIDR
ncbi:MAG TPA: hypothetical protein PLP19_14385 [bacterium]|nr:hypothetical protein [bacterium]HPN44678.1 hypothetical protein [bacterium]